MGADSKETRLLLLRNGGRVAGITPHLGGRIVLYRMDSGPNALNERPELWNDATPTDLTAKPYKQYYGESVWTGPQSDWWTREPYPPKAPQALPGEAPSATPNWPPDPSWEMAAYTVVSQSASRVVMRSPISFLTGLQMTKTVDLRPDGTLVLQVSALNCGDRVVTRDLWLLARPPMSVRCILPLEEAAPDAGFSEAVTMSKSNDLTVLDINAKTAVPKGKLAGTGSGNGPEGWMATVTPEQFFIIRFPITPSPKLAPGCTAIIIFCSTAWQLMELEYHGPLTVLNPGQAMTTETTWQIIPNPGLRTAEEQTRYLRTKVQPALP